MNTQPHAILSKGIAPSPEGRKLFARMTVEENLRLGAYTRRDRAQVVGHDQVPAGVVTMNSRVCCRDEGTGKEYQLTLVYPQEAGKEGAVSVLAPVGTALLGLTVGQHIDWPAPGGKLLKLTLLSVDYQPEAAGEYNR